MKEFIRVCTGRWCSELGGERIYDKLKKKFSPFRGKQKATVRTCRCLGYCEQGANILIDDESIIHDVTEENVFDKLTDKSTHRPFRVVEEEIAITDDFLGDI